MSDHLHQFNVSYVPLQDRLLLRINTRGGDEFRLWLSRRFTGLLLDLLDKEIDRHGGVPTLAAAPTTTKMFKEGAMEKPYDTDHISDYPLGEAGILATRANLKRVEENVVLELLPNQGQGITLNLNKTLLFMFHNLLTQGCGQADWRLGKGDNSAARVH